MFPIEANVFKEMTLRAKGIPVLIDGKEVMAVVPGVSMSPGLGGDSEIDNSNEATVLIALDAVPEAILNRRPSIQVRGEAFQLESFDVTESHIEIAAT